MKKIIFAMGLLQSVVITLQVSAQDMAVFYRVVSPTTTVVTALSPHGILSWSNAAIGVTGYIQRATMLDGNSNWTEVTPCQTTGTFMSVPTADYLVVDISGGPSATNYPLNYLTTVPSGDWPDEYKTTKLVLRRIPAGTFSMGSPTNEFGRYSDETNHQVVISQPFYIGVFEVTQQQWERVMGDWPSYFSNATYRNSRPAEQVRYGSIRGWSLGAQWPANGNVDADSFMGRLRSRTGKAFDLPTEAQWEYVSRAGTTTALNTGYNLTDKYYDVRMAEVGRYLGNSGSYSSDGDTSVGTAKVGSYLPNQWGLYDIHGNVWEWCLDWYGTYPGSVTDPVGAATGPGRVFRGGSWNNYAYNCRVARRDYNNPAYPYFTFGFRAALPPGQQ